MQLIRETILVKLRCANFILTASLSGSGRFKNKNPFLPRQSLLHVPISKQLETDLLEAAGSDAIMLSCHCLLSVGDALQVPGLYGEGVCGGRGPPTGMLCIPGASTDQRIRETVRLELASDNLSSTWWRHLIDFLLAGRRVQSRGPQFCISKCHSQD